MENDCASDSSDSEASDSSYSESSESNCQDVQSIVDEPEAEVRTLVRGRRRNTIVPNYTTVKVDTTFTGHTGYSHFGRTHKGGDVRPNGTPPTLGVSIQNKVTIHNFFASPGKNNNTATPTMHKQT